MLPRPSHRPRRDRLAPAGLLLFMAAACAPAPPPPPHVVLLSIDTLRRDALPAYDPSARPLPALDAFAAESVRFERALSTASWTLPAHASLLTGLYPDRHGATDRRVTMADGVATLAERLAARGYETAAFTGGGFLDPEYGLGRGFERYAAKRHGKQERAENAEGLLARVTEYLRGRRDGRPLFLFLHTYAVHNYYDGRDEAAARAGRAGLASRKAYVDCVLGRTACGEETWDTLRALYRAELELLDDAFARLVAELERAEIWQDALVVLLSDPGTGVAPGLDGRSFATTLRDGTPLAPRPLLAMEHYFGWQDGKRDTSAEVLALPRALAVIAADGWYITGERPDELYDPADARQGTNRLRTAAEAQAYRALLGARPHARAESGLADEDEALGSALDALGYGGGDE